MSDEQHLDSTANSYSPTNLTESYHPQGSSEPPSVIPQLISGVVAAPVPKSILAPLQADPSQGESRERDSIH